MAEDSLANDIDKTCFGAILFFGVIVTGSGVVAYKLISSLI